MQTEQQHVLDYGRPTPAERRLRIIAGPSSYGALVALAGLVGFLVGINGWVSICMFFMMVIGAVVYFVGLGIEIYRYCKG